MKMNITPLKTAAVAAVIGLSPALIAQSSMNSQQSNQQQNNRSSSAQQQNRSSSTQEQQQAQQRQQSQQAQNAQASSRSQSVRPMSEDPRGWHASELIGWEVTSQNGEKLGDLKDFIVDSRSGKLVYGVVGSGGVLGVGETLRAVPFKALKQDTTSEDKRLTLNIDQAKWTQAPVFVEDQLASLSQDQRGQQIFQYYGQSQETQSSQRSAQQSQKQSQSQSQQGSPQLALVSDTIGKDIRNGSQTVGTVDDVIVQLKNRTAAALIDPNDDFAGTDQKYIVPFNKLTLAGEDTLNTTLSRQDFASARPSQDDSWGSETIGYVSTLYVWPMYTAESNRQAFNESAAERSEDRVSQRESQQSGDRMAQSGSQQQSSPVEAIRQAIKSESAQSNVNVTSSGEKVVLTGTVQSEDVKDRIEDRAERAAQGWDIDNQIRVAQQEE